MEGIGFLTAIHANSGQQRIEAIIIRGISDLLVGKSSTDDEKWQPRAANNAAGFAFAMLEKLTKPQSIPNFLPRYLDYLKNDHSYLKFKGLSLSQPHSIHLFRQHLHNFKSSSW